MIKFIDKIFTSFLFFIDRMYTFIVVKLSGYHIISIFINFYILIPIYSIYKSIFLVNFNIYILLFFVFNTLLLYVIIRKYNYIYTYIIKMIFSNIAKYNMKFISLGAFFLKKYPFRFAVYIFISISSIFLIRDYPTNTYIYIIHCICVIFRNIFIIPALGYALIINTNKKQCERLQKDQLSMYLFRQFPLRYQENFLENYVNWIVWFSYIKPSFKIVKSISYVSFITTLLWFSLNIFKLFVNIEVQIISSFMDNNRKLIDIYTSELLSKNKMTFTSTEINDIAINMKKKMNFYYIEYNIYKDDNFKNPTDYLLYLLKRKRIKELRFICTEIYTDYQKLTYCESLNKNSPEYKTLIADLIEKYKS